MTFGGWTIWKTNSIRTTSRIIERLLKQSPGDRRRLARLRDTRELIADCDLAHAPEDDRAAESLHDRIMAQIDGSVTETDPERGKETTRDVRIRIGLGRCFSGRHPAP